MLYIYLKKYETRKTINFEIIFRAGFKYVFEGKFEKYANIRGQTMAKTAENVVWNR